MRYFLIVCLSLVVAQMMMFVSYADAQTRGQPRGPTDQIDEMLGDLEKPKEPQTLADYTRLHYEQCMQKKHPILGGLDLKNMCTCASSLFPENMSLEQIKAMENGGSEGAFQRDRMMLFVYTPCIKPVLKKMMLSQCMGAKKSGYLMDNQSVTCSCIAERIGDNMTKIAPGYIKNAETNFPGQSIDPLDVLVHEATFKSQMSHNTRVCIELYEDP